MAGIKITELPSLATAASDDVLYIVDTSTNTSKQIEVGNIYFSGEYQSTESDLSGTGFNTLAINEGLYTRIGENINYGCNIEFSLTATGVGEDQLGQFDIDFPEKVNNFNLDWYSFNLFTSNDMGNTISLRITPNDLKATININSLGTGSSPLDGVLYLTAFYKP